MKKKGDLTKLLKEGKLVSLPGRISIFFLLFPLVNLFPQKVINNFGISEYLKTYPSYTEFDLIDFNNDGVMDLFLYGNQRKNFSIHQGINQHQYSAPITKFFFFPIDDFGWLTKSDRGDDYYVFVSRNRRLAGLVSFTKSSSLELLNTFNFDSYPSSLKIVDLDGNGKNEALIYGNNFDGLLLLRNEGYRLVADTLYKQRVFSDAEVIDFSQDEVDDLIVIDALYNSVNFLENTEIGGFFSARIIEFEEILYSSQLTDINNDSFSDLIIAKENGFKIFFGDSVFSYSESFNSEFKFTPSDFLISDINSDDVKDIIAIDYLNNKANIDLDIFKGSKNIEFKFPDISDINIFPNNEKAIYILSKKGKFQIITNQQKWGSDFNLSIGGIPDKFVQLNSERAKDSLVLISHEYDNSISSIRIDGEGRFISVETIPFVNEFNEYISESNLSKIAGYTINNRLIEIIAKNYENELYGPSKYLYTKYPIDKILLDDQHNFEIIESNQDTLFHGIMETQDGEYNAEKPEIIDTNVIASIKNSSGNIYYWKRDNNNLFLNEYFGDSSRVLLKIAIEDSTTLPNATIIEDQIPNSGKIFTVLKIVDNESYYLVEDNRVHELEVSNDLFLLGGKHSFNMKYYSNLNGKSNLFVHRFDLKRLELYNIDKSIGITFSNYIDGIELNDYFIWKYLSYNYLIYTNRENYCISFKVFDQ